MLLHKSLIIVTLLALGACSDPERLAANAREKGDTQRNGTVAIAARGAPATTASVAEKAGTMAAPRSCAAEIGVDAAALRVKVCSNLSPATHPPCNAANSCAMIENEIARSCALFRGDGPPMEGCGSESKSMQAAASVVRRYYSAIDARDYATAWSQWGDGGRPDQTFEAFKNGFAHTRSTRVTVGALSPAEGAAGSIYQTVPVTVDATLDDGSHQRFTGSYIVRRVNGVEGASLSQLRWHIDSARLRQTPAG